MNAAAAIMNQQTADGLRRKNSVKTVENDGLIVASKRRRVLTVRERQHRAMLRFAAWIAALSLALVLREG